MEYICNKVNMPMCDFLVYNIPCKYSKYLIMFAVNNNN